MSKRSSPSSSSSCSASRRVACDIDRVGTSYNFVNSVLDLCHLVKCYYATPAILRGDFNSAAYNMAELNTITLRATLRVDVVEAVNMAAKRLREINFAFNRGTVRGLDIDV